MSIVSCTFRTGIELKWIWMILFQNALNTMPHTEWKHLFLRDIMTDFDVPKWDDGLGEGLENFDVRFRVFSKEKRWGMII